MSLYSTWMDYAQKERNEQERTEFWNNYFAAEKENYIKILDRASEPFKGSLTELAEVFGMEPKVFCGFIDGINSSLAAGEYDIETLEEDSAIDLTCDLKKLYFNMLDAKADWLYGLPQWETLLTEDDRTQIRKEYRVSGTYHNEKTTGRNDPCPCGSGKKYKKCCGV